MELLKKTIRPEFLNRIDEIILFPPLTKKEVRAIVTLQLHLLSGKLRKSDIILKVYYKPYLALALAILIAFLSLTD